MNVEYCFLQSLNVKERVPLFAKHINSSLYVLTYHPHTATIDFFVLI